jgi:predicted DNA-binding antitoxin AbrB/MazE fold protein
MQKTIKAIFEDGVFKPLEKVELKEKTRVQLTITEDMIKKMSEKYFGALKLNLNNKELAELMHKIEDTR